MDGGLIQVVSRIASMDVHAYGGNYRMTRWRWQSNPNKCGSHINDIHFAWQRIDCVLHGYDWLLNGKGKRSSCGDCGVLL
jgi:hypothetical protein